MLSTFRLLKRGDIVRLRSGGPEMVVCGSQGDELVCSWDGGALRDTFVPVTLDLVRRERWAWN